MSDDWYDRPIHNSPLKDWAFGRLKAIGHRLVKFVTKGRVQVSDLAALSIGAFLVGLALMTFLGLTWPR